jgi:hypothetical protein
MGKDLIDVSREILDPQKAHGMKAFKAFLYMAAATCAVGLNPIFTVATRK